MAVGTPLSEGAELGRGDSGTVSVGGGTAGAEAALGVETLGGDTGGAETAGTADEVFATGEA